jgi:N-acetylglucosamine-6-phosphate deacetylase
MLLQRCTLYDAAPGAPAVDLRIEGGRIAAIGELGAAPGGEVVIDAGGRTLIPGLIDVHIHGAGSADVQDASAAALETMSRTLARHGVTGFVGTTFLRPSIGNRHLPLAAERVGARLGGAKLLGLYLEGPFINPVRRGGLPEECIHPAAPGALDEVLALTGGTLRLMTVAPELPGHLAIVERLADAGVVPALGHSDATYDEAKDGFAAGIRHVTHLFNAMRGLHHREPGPLVAIAEDARVHYELIGDGVHVDGRVARFVQRALGPERCVLVTDAMRTLGLPDGRYEYAGREFESQGGAARYLDGTLIGSAISVLEVARRFQGFTDLPFARAIDCASRTPARLLGLEDRKGSIAVGNDADLVLLDADGSVWATFVEGEIVYSKC